MIKRVVLLAAALALPAAAPAQSGPSGALPAFRSDGELSAYLARLMDLPASPSPSSTQPACTAPAPLEPPVTAWEGDPARAPAVVYGRVTTNGCAQAGVLVRIESLNVGTSTAADGSYRLVIPGARIRPDLRVTISVSRMGLSPVHRSITVGPGALLTQNFATTTELILLEDVVVTGTAGSVQGKVAGASITNNQHAGVDEGGIVKMHGDYLVILRRGRLFTVRVGGNRLEPVSMVNAYGPEMHGHAWYDELLVSDSTVVVIGYSYPRGGTEIGLFSIDGQGRLRYRETYHMRSSDYYSSRNYASRLVGTRLVMYAPVPVRHPAQRMEWMPAMRRWRTGGEEDAFQPTLPSTRVHHAGRPLSWRDRPTMHTVTTCDLARPRVECESSAVLGPSGRVFYVSPAAVYVWTTGQEETRSMVYRLPLDGAAPSALRVQGSPVDQFSFLESDDGHLNVLVRSGARGDGMWRAEGAGGDVRLLRVPIRRFGDGRRAAGSRSYTVLPAVGEEDGAFHNRFVGRHLLYGAGSGWGSPRSRGARLVAVRWTDGRVTPLPLDHGVDRIEVMGEDAVVVGANDADLHFTGIRLGRTPRVAQRHVQRDAQQGELRSHGFFYRVDGPEQGVIGLPVRGPRQPGWSHLVDGSASVLFLRNGDAEFRPLGQLAARPEEERGDACVASCVDWYGNARPLFLDGRILALMGYEIVEGAEDDGRIREVRRTRFAPTPPVADTR